MAPAPLGFTPSQRLLARGQFDVTMKRGQRSRDELFTVFGLANGQPQGRLGITVSRRSAARAVQRNRIRRQVRESFRHNQSSLAGLDVVVMAHSHAAASDNSVLRGSLERHWDRIIATCKRS